MKHLLMGILASIAIGSLNVNAKEGSYTTSNNPFIKVNSGAIFSGCMHAFNMCAQGCSLREGVQANSQCVNDCRAQMQYCADSQR